jgi:hypothetical protein
VIFLGIALVLVGGFVMAWSRRLQRLDTEGDQAPTALSLSAFLLGGAAVAVGAVIVTDWWVG